MEGEGRQAGASAMMATERKRVACGKKKKKKRSLVRRRVVLLLIWVALGVRYVVSREACTKARNVEIRDGASGAFRSHKFQPAAKPC
jgi:hypothetical protein